MIFSTTPKKEKSIASLWAITKVILNTLDFNQVVQKVCDSLLFELNFLNAGYRIIVLTLLDEKTGTLKRISLSQTEEANRALQASAIPFHQIEIPISAKDNLLIKALVDGRPYVTSYWPDIFRPILTDDQALTNQKAAGIKTSMVFPVISKDRPIGSLIFSLIKDYSQVTDEEKDLLGGFTDLVGLAVQNSSLYTSLAKTTQQLRDANKKLEELDKLKDDFVSIASHELRTPMTAIRSYVWMALNKADINLSPKIKRYLGRTLISTERLIYLVNDMLNISRIESGRVQIEPSVFDIQKLVADVIEEVGPKAKERSLNLVSLDSAVPKVFADPDKVHQVLLNLIGNSLKFTPNEGSVTISFFSDGNFVEVSIKDSGVGILKDDLSSLFKKFGRLDNTYVAAATSGGTGLGLYISRSLIELMGGKIWAYSEGSNKGSTFSFSLPAANKEVLSHQDRYTNKVFGEAKVLEPVAI